MTTQTYAEAREEARTIDRLKRLIFKPGRDAETIAVRWELLAAQTLDELAELNSPLTTPTDPLVLTGALTLKDAK